MHSQTMTPDDLAAQSDMDHPPAADLAQAQQFLDLLGGPDAKWSFQTFDDDEARKKERAKAAKAAHTAALAAGRSKAQAEEARDEAGKDPFTRVRHGQLADRADAG